MHDIEIKVRSFLEKVANDPLDEIPADILNEFKEACGRILIKQLATRREPDFRLRMSNIGKDIRQLQLEKEHGLNLRANPDFIIKMIYGDITEAIFTPILKLAGVNIEAQSKEVSLDVDGFQLKGELDLRIDGEVWDTKSASNWAYNNKFVNWETLAEGDSFGYTTQVFGYAMADDCRAGGFIVLNKEKGEWKLVQTPQSSNEYDLTKEKIYDSIAYKVGHINNNLPMPECPGVSEESFRKVPTGERVLTDACRFCSHKDKCHPGISNEPARSSKAASPDRKWYLPKPS